MDNDDETGSNGELFYNVSPDEKEKKNKRKCFSDFLPEKIDMSSLTEFPRYELLEEQLSNTSNEVGLLDGFDTTCKGQEADEWAHPLVLQFQSFLSQSLHAAFKTAIGKIVEHGYSKDIAEQTFLKCGLYHNTKDTISNAVEGALIFMSREKELETARCNVFSDIDKLVEYTIVEMVSVLKEIRPGVTVAEALWLLLICDGNLLHACVVNRDNPGSTSLQEMFGEASFDAVPSQLKQESTGSIHPCLNNVHFSKFIAQSGQSSQPEDLMYKIPTQLSSYKESHVNEGALAGKESLVSMPQSVGKSPGTGREHSQNVTRGADKEGKIMGFRKGSSGSSKRELLRQKPLHLEKSYKGRPRGHFKTRMGLDKPVKFPPGSPGLAMKSALSKMTPSIGAKSPLSEDKCIVSDIAKSVTQATGAPGTLTSKGTVFALPAVSRKIPASSALESEPSLRTGNENHGLSVVPDCCAEISDDESSEEDTPQDEKEEALWELGSHLKELHREIQGWSEWASEKVMQATQRLSKEQVELKMLKQQKKEVENFKDKQSSEDSNLKRLSEMEFALTNANNQVQLANSTIRSLENENKVMEKQLESDKRRTSVAAKNLEEVFLREQELLKRSEAMDKMKVSLQEELTTLRHRTADLVHQLEKATERMKQLEVLWRQEEREKQKNLAQAENISKQIEEQKAKTKAQEDYMREKADSNLQNYNQSVKELENEISQLRSRSESSKIAALVGGFGLNYGRRLTGSKMAFACESSEEPEPDKRLAVSQDNFGEETIKPERECVMCLTEEMSVLFFPCAHQVLCRECNVLHEKQGMTDCPSCRTPIQERIYVLFEDRKCSRRF